MDAKLQLHPLPASQSLLMDHAEPLMVEKCAVVGQRDHVAPSGDGVVIREYIPSFSICRISIQYSADYCGTGCQNGPCLASSSTTPAASTLSTSAASTSSPSVKLTSSGQCGTADGGSVCGSWPAGSCCSGYGWCGNSCVFSNLLTFYHYTNISLGPLIVEMAANLALVSILSVH